MKNISNARILRKYAASRYMTHLLNMPVSDGSSGKNGIIFMKQVTLEYLLSYIYIYILIALALDESIILDVPQFPMQNIYQSCDLGRAIGRRNVNAIQ